MLPYFDAHITQTTVDHGDADSLVVMAERILDSAPAEELRKRQIKALLERPDASDVLSQVQIPTLVMASAFDSWATPAQHQEIANLIPANPEAAVIGPSGHMMMMEEPQLVAHHFNQWLA
jgi:pimeloyl-ACP methyl ester carboxylesterase